MLLNNRVIYSDNGTIDDISNEMSDINTGSKVIPVVAAEDYLFIGSELPFNHRYISVSVANDQASSVSVDLWDGTAWVAAVDVQDFTAVSGATLGQSGHIMWSLHPNYSWMKDDTNYNSETITGLSSARIFGLYWARLSFSANLKNTTAIKYMGHKFAEDIDLKNRYPDLIRTTVLAQFATGKTNWEEQHILAAESIIKDLKAKKVMVSANQILDYRIFTEAAVYRLAEMIFMGLGRDYNEIRKEAEYKYNKAISMGQYNLDDNQDTRLTIGESVSSQGWLRR